jgi:hypothetical protein
MDKNFPSNLGPRGRMDTRRNYFAAAAEISRRGAVVVVQHATQTLPPLDHTCFSKRAWLWADYPVGQALVVALSMVMQNELSNPCAQRALTEQDHPLQAGFLDAAYESLGRRVGVRSQLHPMST